MFRVGPQIEALEQLLTSHRAALALNLQRRCAKIWVTTCHLRNVIHGFCLLRTNKHEMILDQKTITRWSFFHYRRRLMLGCFSYGVENRVRQPIIKIRLERRSTAINMVSVFPRSFTHKWRWIPSGPGRRWVIKESIIHIFNPRVNNMIQWSILANKENWPRLHFSHEFSDNSSFSSPWIDLPLNPINPLSCPSVRLRVSPLNSGSGCCGQLGCKGYQGSVSRISLSQKILVSSGLCISLKLHVALVSWAPFQHRPPHSLRWSETRSPWVAKMDRRGASVRFNEAAKLGLRDHKCWGCYKKTTSSQAAKVWQRSERCGCSHSMNVGRVNWFWFRKQNKGKSVIDKTHSGSPIFLLHLDASSLNFSGVVKYPSWNAIYHPLFLKRPILSQLGSGTLGPVSSLVAAAQALNEARVLYF